MESKLTEARRSLRNAKILAEMEMPLSAINNVNNAIELFEKEMEQHRLSIPKKIAEELDGFNPNECETKIELLIVGYYKSFLSDELMSFCLANNGLNLCAFYLAGKALGVELVEVTDE